VRANPQGRECDGAGFRTAACGLPVPSLRIRLALATEDVRESRRDGLPLSRLLTRRYVVLVALGR
jgi:hypothetical protein